VELRCNIKFEKKGLIMAKRSSLFSPEYWLQRWKSWKKKIVKIDQSVAAQW